MDGDAAGPGPSQHRRVRLAVVLAVVVVAGGLAAVVALSRGGGSTGATTTEIRAAAGGQASLGDQVSVVFAPGALSADTTVSIRPAREETPLPGASAVGEAYDVGLGGATLRSPATVRVRIPERGLPEGADRAMAFVAHFDEAADRWEPLTGQVTERDVSAAVDHFSLIRAFVWVVQKVVDAAVAGYVQLLRLAGARARPPSCATAPDGFSYKVEPFIVSGVPDAPPAPYPELVDMVLACAEGAERAGVVTAKVVNNRSYSLVLELPTGATAPPSTPGNLDEGVSALLHRLFSTRYFLPSGGEATVTMRLADDGFARVPAAASQLGLFVDAVFKLVSVFYLPAATVLGIMECAYANVTAGDGGPPSLAEAPAILKECAEPLLDAAGLVLLAAVYPLLKAAVEQKIQENDRQIDLILGGGEAVVVRYEAGVTTTTTSTTTTTTTVPPAPVVLAVDGLGVATFGTDMEAAIAALTASLGPADYTGAWHARYCGTGEGGGGRLLVWGKLSVMFNDGGLFDPNTRQRSFVGQRVLWGYEYTDHAYDQGAGRDVAIARRAELRTPSGAGTGTTGADLERIYAGRITARRGDPVGFPPPSYAVTVPGGQMLYFSMDANGPQGKVKTIAAGRGCGE